MGPCEREPDSPGREIILNTSGRFTVNGLCLKIPHSDT